MRKFNRKFLKETALKNPFPLHVFHPNIISFINLLCSKDGYDIPPSFVGTTLLSAYSTAIGTSYAVTANGKDLIYLPVWAGLVGISSSGKSLAISKIYEPLFNIQDAYDIELQKLSEQNIQNQSNDEFVKTLIIRDVTVPTLI